jgi:hypothetical protein
VALSTDIRTFNMKYGVLSEVFDKDIYNLADRLVYLKRDKKRDVLFFAEISGHIKQLNFNNDKTTYATF